MPRFAKIVKEALIPGSTTFLVVGLTVGVALLNAGPWGMHWGRTWLTLLLALHWLLSLPVVAHVLIANLHEEFGTIRTVAEARGAKVLVVIGNGSVHYEAGAFTVDMLTRRSHFCVFEAARLWRMIRPDWVVVSGGVAGLNPRARSESDLMCEQLVRFEVPADRILLEAASRNTAEQIGNVARLLEDRGLAWPVIVVTTGAHMSRVMKLFLDRQLDAIPSVTPELRYDEGRAGWRRWVPSFAALRGSESALYEHFAHVYLAITRKPT